eukprot:g5345.t2
MFQKALSGLDHLYRPGLSGKDESCPIDEQDGSDSEANSMKPLMAPDGLNISPHAAHDSITPLQSQELGQWHYLVTDPKGIQPRQEPMYSSKDPAKPKRPMGAVLEISLRRRSGWTRWLQVGEEEWLFDISPKDRKVRMVEVELQKGSWDFEVSVAELKLYPIPGAKNSSGTMKLGETFTADEKVRPRRSRGAFLHVAGTEHWALLTCLDESGGKAPAFSISPMAVDPLAMEENLRWEGATAEAHLKALSDFHEFNYWISEYFETPAPAQNVLDSLAVLMQWSGDSKQIVTQMTGQRHTEDSGATCAR